MTCSSHDGRFPTGRLVLGLVLLSIGAGILLDRIDVIEIHDLWEYWPVVLIVVGLVGEVDALVARRGDGGFVAIAVGAFFAARMELFGLERGMAFPLAAIIVGAGLAIHALVDRSDAPAKKEESDYE